MDRVGTQRIVVMIAMEEEAQFFKPYLDDMRRLDDTPGIVATYRGALNGATVDVCVSGIGAVYAATAITAALLHGPQPVAVLSCGCAGAHRPDQAKGDIVLGALVTPLSAQVVDRQGKTRQSGVRCSMLDQATTVFEADPSLLQIGTAAANAFCDEWTVDTSDGRPPRVDVGTVGSSDVWRQDPKLIAEVSEQTGSLCEEMEAHSLAQVCKMFKVPFLAIKDIANSEIYPEEIQLEPTHSVVPESSPVGVHAANVTAKTIALLVNDDNWGPQLVVRPTSRSKAGSSHDALVAAKRPRAGVGSSEQTRQRARV